MILIATFYTHAAALVSCRNLKSAGFPARMMPVPRALSSSCGTCVRYEAEELCEQYLDRDIEQIAVQDGQEQYRVIRSFE